MNQKLVQFFKNKQVSLVMFGPQLAKYLFCNPLFEFESATGSALRKNIKTSLQQF